MLRYVDRSERRGEVGQGTARLQATAKGGRRNVGPRCHGFRSGSLLVASEIRRQTLEKLHLFTTSYCAFPYDIDLTKLRGETST